MSADLCGVRLGQGTLDSFSLRTAERLENFDEQLKAVLATSCVLNFDES